jgi:mannitol-1-phosphate 5-dehydrogenase
MMSIVLFGAGKIARGFIGHLLWKAGYAFRFVEYNPALVKLLKERKRYAVRILGEEIRIDTVTNFDVWGYEDIQDIEEAIASDVDTMFVSVGGKNLQSVGVILKSALRKRMEQGSREPMNIVLCENWIKPAEVLKSTVYEGADNRLKLFLDQYVGFTESVIMRSAIEPTEEVLLEDPLAVNVQDFWYLPIDRKRIKKDLPELEGLAYIDDFDGYLDRKFYTYNAANGTVSYLGSLKHYTYIAEAARDPEILEILEKVYEETGRALCAKHGFDYKSHMEFTRTSLAKLQNRFLVDYIERNARDPMRKLGPSDRLVGPARLVIQFGGVPEGLATSIAAALFYEQPSDPIAMQLKSLREQQGIDYILQNICRLDKEADKQLISLIKEKIEMLRERGWVG